MSDQKGTAPQQTTSETIPQLSPETAVQLRALDQKYRLARTLVRWVGVIVLAYFAKEAVISFAGRSTSVLFQAGVEFFSDVRVSISVALAGCCALWAMIERVIRQRRVEQLHARVKELELGIDPQRTSSQLTTKGKTNPKDRSV